MSRNDARPTGDETISQADPQPERNRESNEAVQGESGGIELDTEDNYVQREVQQRGEQEKSRPIA